MPRRGPDVFQIKVTTASATGSFRDISQQVEDFSGFDVEAILELVHSFGDTYEESANVGVNRIATVTLGGPLDDDTTTGINQIFGNSSDLGAERVLRLNFNSAVAGAAATASPTNVKMDVLPQSYRRRAARGALTRYELVLQPTGTFSVVTTT